MERQVEGLMPIPQPFGMEKNSNISDVLVSDTAIPDLCDHHVAMLESTWSEPSLVVSLTRFRPYPSLPSTDCSSRYAEGTECGVFLGPPIQGDNIRQLPKDNMKLFMVPLL
jgi:hypothetical protein